MTTLTATDIAGRLGVEGHRVRWLLQRLRDRGLVDCQKIGQTFTYDSSALGKVRTLLKESGKIR